MSDSACVQGIYQLQNWIHEVSFMLFWKKELKQKWIH